MNSLKKYERLIGVIVVIIFSALIFNGVAFLWQNAHKNPKDPAYSTAFFIKNKDNLYAMFNEDGRKLTDFIYTEVGNFYNGVVMAKDQNGNAAILNEKGKYILKPNKYKTIIQYGALFKATNDNESKLLNSHKKSLLKTSDFDVSSYASVEAFVVVSLEKTFKVLNYAGKTIYTFKKVNEENNSDNLPLLSQFGEYGSVYYNNLTVIFNINTGKVIAKIKGSEHYSINRMNEKANKIVLNTSTFGYDENNEVKYMALVNGKLDDKVSGCDMLSLEGDNFICTTDSQSYLLDDKLRNSMIDVSLASYKDANTYAIKDDDNILIMKNNKTIKKIESAILSDKGYTSLGYYLVYKDGVYQFYNDKGDTLFEPFKKAMQYDENGLARVSLDGFNYYFIDASGRRVGDDFDTSYLTKDFYIISRNDKKGVMDKEANKLVPCDYESVDIRTNNNRNYAFLKMEAEYELYSLDSKKRILTFKDTPSFFDHYLKVREDDKDIYYTYDGKKLYEE